MFDKSFSLTRTNPKLSGNVKIVVSSDGKIYLESYDANRTLSADRFKHFEIKKEEYYKEVIPLFFSDVENNSIFDVRRLNDISETYDDYSFQFDDTYYTGAQFTQDVWYQEEYEYTAPLYLNRKNLPKSFIILRVDGSGSLSQSSDSTNFRSGIIDRWKFIKRYDLTDTSIFGEWFERNFVNDIGLPDYPLIIEHGDVELSTVSGIDVKKGGWVEKSLTLKDALSDNSPIFRTEEFITDLWKDNEIIYPELVNLKFLYDDNPATPETLRKYTINRYLGFYVDEEQKIKSVSPFQGFELNKTPLGRLEEMTVKEISEIPYLKNNLFIRQIDNRIYSFDPIKNGWIEGKNYWIEWKGNYYPLERTKNNNTNLFDPNQIIGDYLYKVIASENIQWDLNEKHFDHPTTPDSNSELVVNGTVKVLIDELSTDKDRIIIDNELKFNNSTVNNVIENANTTFITYKRIFEEVEIDGQLKYVFRILLDSEIDNNLFDIPNYDEADLHLMRINEEDYYVIKRFGDDISNISGKFYLHSDYAISIKPSSIRTWINNGNITRDDKFYSENKIENISPNEIIPFFDIIRINFTDIKDFDFDRIETDYTRQEYEKELEVTNTLESKLFAKEWRERNTTINTIESDRARRIPKKDINNRPINIRDLNGESNPITGGIYTPEELYYKDSDGRWMLFEGDLEGEDFANYTEDFANLRREYYREEDYIWRLEEDDETLISEINFILNSDPNNVFEELIWGENGKSEFSTNKLDLPLINSTDPNITIDTNYIPVSSEYITTDELWEIRNQDLTPIWDKNQSICKWGSLNSKARQDQPYRLNYSIDVGDLTNREPNANTNTNFPERPEMNLDYFYRFGIENPQDYQYYTLHINAQYFDIDRYFSQEFDYFEYLLNADYVTSDGLQTAKKYSLFNARNKYNDPFSVFKGVKYHLLDVNQIVFDEEELEENDELFVDDIITNPNTKYDGYKFSIIFGRKLSTFNNNSGNGNSNMGIDIYLNDKWKNVIIHIYINTDEILQINDINSNTINAETTPIDIWYEDNLEREDINPNKWKDTEFKINNFGIGLRPRDLMLWEFINILDNYNFDPNDSNREIINFIHIYEDGTSKIMDYTNTDFIIDTDLPDELILKEEAYVASKIEQEDLPDFNINNTLKNRRIVDNDPNSQTGDPEFTSEGLKIDSVNDINSYNEYPIAKEINDNLVDTRRYWELSDETDPSIFRHNGAYVPIFKQIPLFRPYGYKGLKDSSNDLPILESGNWKFYDPNSSKDTPSMNGFGLIEEIIYSKVNTTTNILKIDDPDNREKSIYPMVDEYGYDYDSRYMFASNWEQDFYYESKEIDVPVNDNIGVSGYSVRYDGIEDFLVLPDQTKFNLETFIIDEVNYNNYIDKEPTGERSFQRLLLNNVGETFISTDNDDLIPTSDIQTIKLDMVAGATYEIEYKLLDHFRRDNSTDLDPTTILGLIIEIENDPNNPDQSGTKYLLMDDGGLDDDVTIVDVIVGEQTGTIRSGLASGDYKVEFNTSQFNDVRTRSSVDRLNIPSEYINGTTIPVTLYIGLYNSSSKEDAINLELTFRIKDSLDNFLDIDIGNELLNNDIKNTLIEGYFKKDSETGDILNYKSIGSSSDAEVYSEAELDNIFSEWKEYAGIENPRSGRIGVSPFTGKIPKNWHSEQYYDIMNRLVPNSGNSLSTTISNGGFGGEALYHYLEYGSQDPSTIPNPLSATIHENYRFGSSKIENEFFKINSLNNNLNNPIDRGFNIVNEVIDNTPDGNTLQNTISPMRISNPEPFDFEPDYSTRIEDGNCITYVGETNGTLTNPTIIYRWYTTYRENVLKFQIVPDNSKEFEVKVNIKRGDSVFDRFTSNDVIQSINNKLPTNYEATKVSENKNFVEFKINHQLTGSYFNFKSNIITTRDLKIQSISNSGNISSTSTKLCKTSIKDDSVRNTGYLKDITVEFYVNIAEDSWSKKFETILYKGLDTSEDVWEDSSFTDFTFIIGKFNTTDKLAFRTCHEQLGGSFEHNTLISTIDINDGLWHHVACVFDLKTRTKTIYIDSVLDAQIDNFLEPTDLNGEEIDDTPDERELVALFLDNRERFLPGRTYPKLGLDSVLANKIRLDLQDTNTLYWYDVIRGIRPIELYDQNWQFDNWGTDITKAYSIFEENFKSLDYYLRTSTNNNWDLLIATDSITSLGRRNFEGFIDELRIWNYARSQDQIIQNYRFILRPEAYLDPLNTLISYIRFDEGSGVSEIGDLMDNHLIKDMDRWSKTETNFINDGNTEQETDIKTIFNFERSFYKSETIKIENPDDIDWDVSGAEMVGLSDERNSATPPDPITTQTSREIEKPIFKRTKSVIKKKQRRRFRFNIKRRLFAFTKKRLTKSGLGKWWKLKNFVNRKIATKVKTFKVKLRIKKKGKSWLGKVRRLVRKRRRR